MKKVFKFVRFFVFLLAICSTFIITAYAADLNVVYDSHSWDGVGEVEVQFIKDKFNLNNAQETFNGDFEFRTNKGYSVDDKNNVVESALETFRAERDTEVSYDMLENGDKIVVYTGTLVEGTNNINGSITLKFPKAALLNTSDKSTYADITMTVSNIVIQSSMASTKPIFLLRSSTSTKRMWNGISYARQENENGNAPITIGASYDLSFKVTKAGTDEVVNGAVGISFRDLDMGDRTSGTSDINGKYAESITIMTDLYEGESIHRVPNSEDYLEILDTEFGKNTKFKAKLGENLRDDVERRKAGFATRVNANDFQYRWTGTHAEMEIGFFLMHEVETSTSGEYPNNVNITNTDDKVFWKENKKIEMVPDEDFYVSKITIDDIEIPYEELNKNSDGTSSYEKDGITYTFKEENGRVTYVFNSVITDHEIDVQVEKNEVIDENPKTGTISKLVIVSLILVVSAITIFIISRKRTNNSY